MTETPRRGAGPRGPVAVLGALALLVLAGAGPAGADPVDDAQGEVNDLRAEIDAASGDYFDALATFEKLRVDIDTLEHDIKKADTQADQLDKVVERRAVEAYTTGGSTKLAFVVDTASPLESRRATYLLEQANAKDNTAIDELVALNQQREAQSEELAAQKDAQQAALASLQEEQRALDAQLAQAVGELDSAIASRAAAQRAAQQAQESQSGGGGGGGGGGSAQPAEPPPDYVPKPGEHPHHMDPFLVCTRGIESGGNYQIVSSDGLYHGAYQFAPSTWNTTAAYAGRPELIGVPPEAASEYDQDDVAWTLYQWQGNGPWGGRC